jgi:hypothetical protein
MYKKRRYDARALRGKKKKGGVGEKETGRKETIRFIAELAKTARLQDQKIRSGFFL